MRAVRPAPLALAALAALAGACVEDVAAQNEPTDIPAPRTPDEPLDPDTPRTPSDPVACDPGTKTIHRLNRTEYDRTVRDLLGVTSTPAAGFPADDVGTGGFDNNADVLTMSPLLVEKLDAAAKEIAAEVFPDVAGGGGAGSVVRVDAENVGGDVGGNAGEFWNLWSNGDVVATISATSAGRYRVQVRADQQAAGPEDAQMSILVDGAVAASVVVDGLDTYAVEVTLAAGEHQIGARFENDFYDPDAGLDRNLLLDFFALEGPLDAPVGGGSLGRDRFVSCDVSDVAGCATASVTRLLEQAFRRPVTADDVAPYVGLVTMAVAEGDGFDAGMRLVTEAVLLSPSFLFRPEFDDGATGKHRLSQHELASRLSYFIWSSMPDAALFAKANDGTLATPSVLRAEVDRMLADDKAQGGVVDALALKWLNARAIDNAAPDPTLYPLSDAVRAAMKQETHLVVAELLASDRSAKDLLDVDFTYVNAALAAHYGLDADFSADVDADGFVRVSLAGTNRAGVLTQGAYLAANSYPTRTSPVKRGRWVIDSLLCMPPGEIPADVTPLNEDGASGSLRERMEQHRADPSCAACHAMMDPIGFGLESFDPIGRSRSEDADGFVIDDDDVFFDTAFTDPRGLAAALKAQETLGPCMTEKLGAYTLGRGLDFLVDGDACTIDDVTVRAEEDGFSFKDILVAIVEADAFQMRTPAVD